MGKNVYVGKSGVAKTGKAIYVGVNNVAKRGIKAWIGDANGKAQLWWAPVTTANKIGVLAYASSNLQGYESSDHGASFTKTGTNMLARNSGTLDYFRDTEQWLITSSSIHYYTSGSTLAGPLTQMPSGGTHPAAVKYDAQVSLKTSTSVTITVWKYANYPTSNTRTSLGSIVVSISKTCESATLRAVAYGNDKLGIVFTGSTEYDEDFDTQYIFFQRISVKNDTLSLVGTAMFCANRNSGTASQDTKQSLQYGCIYAGSDIFIHWWRWESDYWNENVRTWYYSSSEGHAYRNLSEVKVAGYGAQVASGRTFIATENYVFAYLTGQVNSGTSRYTSGIYRMAKASGNPTLFISGSSFLPAFSDGPYLYNDTNGRVSQTSATITTITYPSSSVAKAFSDNKGTYSGSKEEA